MVGFIGVPVMSASGDGASARCRVNVAACAAARSREGQSSGIHHARGGHVAPRLGLSGTPGARVLALRLGRCLLI